MAIGVSKNEIYHSTVVSLRDYDEAYKIRRKLEDQRDYMMHIYFYDAVSVALGNAFRKKGSKPYELRKQPFYADINKSAEDIAKREADKTMHRLEIMSFNHKLEEARRKRIEVQDA